MAALTLISQAETELSLQQHLDLAPDLLNYTRVVSEGDPEPVMMAHSVPHQSTDRKRVKVYELRNNDWFDRGTGFCTATYIPVRKTPLPHGLPSHHPVRMRARMLLRARDQRLA